MSDFAEKRDFYRMGIQCPAKFRIQGATEVSDSQVLNLSAAGLLMVAPQEISPGTRLAIRIEPIQAITPPLSANASVLRSTATEAGTFEIACAIEQILAEADVGADFP
jgi:hypothetical protein